MKEEQGQDGGPFVGKGPIRFVWKRVEKQNCPAVRPGPTNQFGRELRGLSSTGSTAWEGQLGGSACSRAAQVGRG